MKKTFIIALTLLMCASQQVFAGHDKPITLNELPKAAKELIAKYFPNEKVALAKVDSDLMSKTYEVVFANSAKIDFYADGSWKEIDCEYSIMPEALVPLQIRSKVAELYSGSRVVGIEKNRKGYEVKLSNGIELEFNTKFNLVDIDD